MTAHNKMVKKPKRGTYKEAKYIQNRKRKRELDRVASEEIKLVVDKDKVK